MLHLSYKIFSDAVRGQTNENYTDLKRLSEDLTTLYNAWQAAEELSSTADQEADLLEMPVTLSVASRTAPTVCSRVCSRVHVNSVSHERDGDKNLFVT